MATETVLHLDNARKMACLEAAYELDVIARMLPGLAANNSDEIFASYYKTRCIAGRMLRLTSALMAGLGDDLETTATIADMVYLSGPGQG